MLTGMPLEFHKWLKPQKGTFFPSDFPANYQECHVSTVFGWKTKKLENLKYPQ
jgi:hypothetical protein